MFTRIQLTLNITNGSAYTTTNAIALHPESIITVSLFRISVLLSVFRNKDENGGHNAKWYDINMYVFFQQIDR